MSINEMSFDRKFVPHFSQNFKVEAPFLDKGIERIKKGIWLYFLLLLFEGALRKWFVPGLATPLLLVRDPLAIWLVFKAWVKNVFPVSAFVFSMILIGVIGIYTSVFWGHGNLWVAIYGARIMLFHFPLIFVIGNIFNHNDVIRVGNVLLWISIPMTVLIAMQFYSPQSAWVNRGVGGDINGAGFSGALDYLRPPGTFSFTNGTTAFYSFVCCFIFYFWVGSVKVSRLLLIVSTVTLLAAIPLSISRSLFFQFFVSLAFCLMAVSRNPAFIGKMILAVVGGFIVLMFLSKADLFNTALQAFTVRFDTANEQEGGLQGVLGDRFLGGMVSALNESNMLPFWGYGLGMGTNVGSMMLTGSRIYLIAEDEWPRLIGELGQVLGISVILIRVCLCLNLMISSYIRLAKNDFLPWMLLSFGVLTIAQGQWAQPTSLGFCVFVGGLILAALKRETN